MGGIVTYAPGMDLEMIGAPEGIRTPDPPKTDVCHKLLILLESVRNGFAHVNAFKGLWRYQLVRSRWGPVLARHRRFADQNEFAE